MSIIENVINLSKKAEHVLEITYEVQGRGLHEKLTAAEPYIPVALFKKLRYIATIRNKLVHEHGFELSEPEIFLHIAKQAVNELEAFSNRSLSNDFTTLCAYGKPAPVKSSRLKMHGLPSPLKSIRNIFNNAAFWFPYAILISSALLALSIYVDSKVNGTPGIINRVENAILFITNQQPVAEHRNQMSENTSSTTKE